MMMNKFSLLTEIFPASNFSVLRLIMAGFVMFALSPLLPAHAQTGEQDATAGQHAQARVSELQTADGESIAELDEPLYTPFVERYILDALRNLRTDLERQRSEIFRRLADAELAVANRAISYVADSVTYFFYVIAAASSVLVVVGWRSLSDVRGSLRRFADDEFSSLTKKYESRLAEIEQELAEKSEEIERNQRRLDMAREAHSLWLRATQESAPQNKIPIYDQLLVMNPEDTEALTYKADAALMLNEPRWALSMCDRALEIDRSNGFAWFQRACALAEMQDFEASLTALERAIGISAGFAEDAQNEPHLSVLAENESFKLLVQPDQIGDEKPV